MKTLKYTGPCTTCSLGKSKATGAHIMVTAGQTFKVHDDDADWLTQKYGDLVVEPEAGKSVVRSRPATDETPAADPPEEA